VGSNPSEDDGFLREMIHRMTSLRGEVKLSVPYCNFLWLVKIHTVRKRYFVRKILGHLSLSSPASLLDVSAATRQHWWMNKE
jgi:hypothetical protein